MFQEETPDPYCHVTKEVLYTEEILPGPGANLNDFYEFLDLKCSCNFNNPCSDANSCPCVRATGLNYVNDLLSPGKLLSEVGIYECSSVCDCGDACRNNLIRRGPNKNLRINESPNKGFGVFATALIVKGSFICEYAGEVISKEEADRLYENSNHRKYIMLMREHCTSGVIETYVDATQVGNVGRYINHSCSPNCKIVPVRVGHSTPHLGIFAIHNIHPDEEVSYSYVSDGSTLSSTPCFCFSTKCQGFLPTV